MNVSRGPFIRFLGPHTLESLSHLCPPKTTLWVGEVGVANGLLTNLSLATPERPGPGSSSCEKLVEDILVNGQSPGHPSSPHEGEVIMGAGLHQNCFLSAAGNLLIFTHPIMGLEPVPISELIYP